MFSKIEFQSSITTWPEKPFTYPINPDAFTWLDFAYIGPEGDNLQTVILLGIVCRTISLLFARIPYPIPSDLKSKKN